MLQAEFDALSPESILTSIEKAFGVSLDGMLVPYPSYVNRVYGVKTDDGAEFVAKFYRPGRWTKAAILEEHQFLADCVAVDLPVVLPVTSPQGQTLCQSSAEAAKIDRFFSLFPKRSGRNFDAELAGDWERLGSLGGRLHQVGRQRSASQRLVCSPGDSTTAFLQELYDAELVPSDCEAEFFDLGESIIDRITPLFADIPVQRIHGDLHRGNVLDRGPEGLLLFDFDDMMMGPVVHDLWLLLPDRADRCAVEISQLIQGYEVFQPFPINQLVLIEPLRFMRMIYFLAWCARQRLDQGFSRTFPNWGTKAFWIREIEDLRSQSDVLRSQGI